MRADQAESEVSIWQELSILTLTAVTSLIYATSQSIAPNQVMKTSQNASTFRHGLCFLHGQRFGPQFAVVEAGKSKPIRRDRFRGSYQKHFLQLFYEANTLWQLAKKSLASTWARPTASSRSWKGPNPK
jgi:hypothetical protein